MRVTDDPLHSPSSAGARWKLLPVVWAMVILVWNITHSTFDKTSALWMLCQPYWYFRVFSGERTWHQDLTILLMLRLLLGVVMDRWTVVPLQMVHLDLSGGDMLVHLQIFSLLSLLVFFSAAIVLRGRHLGRLEASTAQAGDQHLLPPMIIPSRTTHSRLFPKKHSFSYPYLYVGVPVGLQGTVGSALSVNSDRLPTEERARGWFSVNSGGYLERSSTIVSLQKKLSEYLHSQGVTNQEYSFAYLVTAPEFLGYSFNPVSFWYLYDDEPKLKYMILEVNNTFDERRMYLLHDKETAKDDSGYSPTDVESELKVKIFTNVWEKDFHVSPFNSRKGSYSLKAADPLIAYRETGHIRIDNTIVLRSSQQHAKIVARVFSEGTPKDPATLSTVGLLRFIAAWWWVGFMTGPRIVKEAWKLYVLRKMHVWSRPEVMKTSVGRRATDQERLLERFFREFLIHLVKHTDEVLRLVYQPSGDETGEIVIDSPTFQEKEPRCILELRVITPAFYSRFVHYAHIKEAFDRECLSTDMKNWTVSITGREVLPVLLTTAQRLYKEESKRPLRLDGFERMRWHFLQRLRCPPAAASYPSNDILTNSHSIRDIRSLPTSEIDRFVQRHCDDSVLYRRIVGKLFLAERYALGVLPLVALLDTLLRVLLILGGLCYLRMLEVVELRKLLTLDLTQWRHLLGALIAANAIHLWSFIKA